MAVNSELHVGCKAMVIGAITVLGQRHIGKIVTCEKFVPEGVEVEYKGYGFAAGVEAWLVSSESGEKFSLINPNGDYFEEPFGAFASRHLMPLPPIVDPGIDDCTFTPIKNQEPVAC